MHRFRGRPVELAVHDSGAGADALQIVDVQHLEISHAVLVGQSAAQDVGENLHVLVTMRAESLAGADAVFVDHAQRSETHVLGVVISREGKGVVAVQPAVIGMAALVALANRDHSEASFNLPLRFVRRLAPVRPAIPANARGRPRASGGAERSAGPDDCQVSRNYARRHHLRQFAPVAEPVASLTYLVFMIYDAEGLFGIHNAPGREPQDRGVT